MDDDSETDLFAADETTVAQLQAERMVCSYLFFSGLPLTRYLLLSLFLSLSYLHLHRLAWTQMSDPRVSFKWNGPRPPDCRWTAPCSLRTTCGAWTRLVHTLVTDRETCLTVESERWALHDHWLALYRDEWNARLASLCERYERVCADRAQLEENAQLAILSRSAVRGLFCVWCVSLITRIAGCGHDDNSCVQVSPSH